MAINKVVYGNSTLIDLTEDTVSADKLLAGETAHDRSGASIEGTVVTAEVVDNLTTQDATKALSAKQGYVLNQKKIDKTASEIQTSDGQFTTVTGGLMQSCIVDLEPIQSGSGTPSPTNVRPISGHTQVQVGNVGKNKLPLTVSGIKSINTSGTWSGNVYSLNGGTFEILVNGDNVIGIKVNGTFTDNTSFYFVATGTSVLSPYLVSGTEYIMNGVPSGTNTVRLDIEYNGSWKTLTTGSTTFTYTSGGEDGVRIYAPANSSASNSIFYPMVRLATETDATYEPYNGYTHIINLGGTYYGGTYDAVSGKFTVTHELVKGNALSWTKHSTTSNNIFYSSNLSNVIKRPSDNYSIADIICSSYDKNAWELLFRNGVYGIACSTSGLLAIANPNITTLSDFQTAIADVDIAYPLATPITIQLTPTQLNTLVGQNDVFAPLVGQTVEEVEFREVLAWDDVIDAIPYESVSPDVGTGEMFTYFKIYRYGRVVVLTFMQDSMIEIPTQATRKIFGVLPERFYTKKSGAMPYNTIKYTFINQKGFGVLAPKLLEIDPTNGNVYADYEADEGICPMGSLTYILDHD